jgi:hypothetical protein
VGLTILYQNFADSALFGGGSYLASLPRENAQDADIGRVARTTDAANASTKLTLDIGGNKPVRGIAIGPTNLSPGSTYRIQAFSDAAMTVQEFDSGIQSFAGSTIDWSDPNNWLEWEDDGFWSGVPDLWSSASVPTWLIEAFASIVQQRYWLIELFDANNADGYVQFGRVLRLRSFPDRRACAST